MSTEPNATSRRALLKSAASVAAFGSPIAALSRSTMETQPPFVSLLRHPDLVRAFGPENREIRIRMVADDHWEGEGVEVSTAIHPTHVALALRSEGNVCRLQFRWHGDLQWTIIWPMQFRLR